MGLFRNLGKQAERFKQQAEEAADETYECEACDTQFHAAYEQCPECGNDELKRA
jgi:ribosomal protein L37AE/L43A